MINNRTEYAIRALWQLSEAKDYRPEDVVSALGVRPDHPDSGQSAKGSRATDRPAPHEVRLHWTRNRISSIRDRLSRFGSGRALGRAEGLRAAIREVYRVDN